jgi:hypothetical protein
MTGKTRQENGIAPDGEKNDPIATRERYAVNATRERCAADATGRIDIATFTPDGEDGEFIPLNDYLQARRAYYAWQESGAGLSLADFYAEDAEGLRLAMEQVYEQDTAEMWGWF